MSLDDFDFAAVCEICGREEDYLDDPGGYCGYNPCDDCPIHRYFCGIDDDHRDDECSEDDVPEDAVVSADSDDHDSGNSLTWRLGEAIKTALA